MLNTADLQHQLKTPLRLCNNKWWPSWYITVQVETNPRKYAQVNKPAAINLHNDNTVVKGRISLSDHFCARFAHKYVQNILKILAHVAIGNQQMLDYYICTFTGQNKVVTELFFFLLNQMAGSVSSRAATKDYFHCQVMDK